MTTAQQGDIVVGVDGSAVSAAALRWAMSEAEASGRTVVAGSDLPGAIFTTTGATTNSAS